MFLWFEITFIKMIFRKYDF